MWEKFKAVSAEIWLYIRPAVVLLITTVGKELMLSAVAAVTKAATQNGLSSPEKRNLAFTQIKADMETAGHVAADSAINLALELAVQKLKISA